MTKNVSITIDIPIARRMLKVAGFRFEEIDAATNIDSYGAAFKVKEEGNLSHIMMLEMERELGPYKTDEVVLFNINQISEEEALRHVEAGLYNPNMLVLPKTQWVSLFRDGKESS